MLRCAPRPWLPALALAWLAAAGFAAADVTDQAGQYSVAAVRKANEDIANIERVEHRELVIETFKTVPAEDRTAFAGMTHAQRDNYLHAWADKRAEARHVYGVYVLLCKSPATSVTVVLGPATEEHTFPQRDRESLAEKLQPGLWGHDRKLDDAIIWFHLTLHRNLASSRAGGSEGERLVWPGVLAAIAALLLLWGGLHVTRHVLDLVERARPADGLGVGSEAAVTVPSGDGLPFPAEEPAHDLERRAEDY